jgi:peptidoglycan hydrolase-like protein with peptidoglycan-binding domain
MYKLSEPGWFSEVNGLSVLHHELPENILEHAGRFNAHHGIEFHVQAGTGRDIFQTEVERGFPIATWNVDDLGQVRQYLDFRLAAWHGDSVSQYAFGIEHTGTGLVALKPKQLDASAALCAAIIEMTGAVFGETIPLLKVPRVSVENFKTVHGFWDHDDVDNGPLNENGHTDHLIGRTWAAQLTKIGDFLKRRPVVAPVFHGTLLRLGVDAPDVIVWKKRMAVKGLFALDTENDGPNYGTVIERSTEAFQTRKGLAVDGIVGPQTWEAAWS